MQQFTKDLTQTKHTAGVLTRLPYLRLEMTTNSESQLDCFVQTIQTLNGKFGSGLTAGSKEESIPKIPVTGIVSTRTR